MLAHFGPSRGRSGARAGLAAGLALLLSAVAGPAGAATPAEAFSTFAAGSGTSVDHSAWDRLLEAYVVPGKDGVSRVRYRAFKSEAHGALKSYVADLQGVDVKNLGRDEQFAFWANLYNAKTIDIILDAYPVASIKDINLGGSLTAAFTGGPWKAKVLKVAGIDMSLDDIEHGVLRPVFKDPRVHYAVNCASVGCPNLGTQSFTAAKLDAQLDDAARAYVNHPRGFAVTDGEARASSIYSWFVADFGGDQAGVLRHIAKYSGETLKPKLKGITAIADYGYDWGLNDAAE